MITKEQYIQALTKELEIVKHLAEKVKPEQMNYKPTENQRTLAEVMEYLSYSIFGMIDAAIKNDRAVYMKYHDEATLPTIESLKTSIDMQIAKIPELIMPLTDEQLNGEVDLFVKQPLVMYLILALKNATAYKMQMFLYMKASGTENIGTSNVWGGADAQPEE